MKRSNPPATAFARSEKLPNFIKGAIYRAKQGRANSSVTGQRFNCFTPASFEYCFSTPLRTLSRVVLMTGLYEHRNLGT